MSVRCPLCLEPVRIELETGFREWPSHEHTVHIRVDGQPPGVAYVVDAARGTFRATSRSVSILTTFEDECCPGTVWTLPTFARVGISAADHQMLAYMESFPIRWYKSTC